jgi:hypothetical protein
MTKGQLIQLAPDPSQIDIAIDVSLAMELRQLGINPDHYATDFSENKVSGKLISLIELERDELRRILKNVLQANTEFIEKIEILERNIRKQNISQ